MASGGLVPSDRRDREIEITIEMRRAHERGETYNWKRRNTSSRRRFPLRGFNILTRVKFPDDNETRETRRVWLLSDDDERNFAPTFPQPRT